MIGNSACRFRLGLGDVLLREVPLPALLSHSASTGGAIPSGSQRRPVGLAGSG